MTVDKIIINNKTCFFNEVRHFSATVLFDIEIFLVFSAHIRFTTYFVLYYNLRKATGSYRTYLSLVKLVPWFQSLQ